MDGWEIPKIDPCDNFGPAAKGREDVFGCGRPYEFKVDEWIQVVREEGISRIVVLCEPKDYSYFIDKFEDEFGQKNVLRATVTDYHLCEKELLNNEIIPFINQSIEQDEKVVVHCNAGSGRTGHVLAAWLYSHEGDMDVAEARKSVSRPGGRGYVSRNPGEAIKYGNATLEDLDNLIRSTRE